MLGKAPEMQTDLRNLRHDLVVIRSSLQRGLSSKEPDDLTWDRVLPAVLSVVDRLRETRDALALIGEVADTIHDLATVGLSMSHTIKQLHEELDRARLPPSVPADTDETELAQQGRGVASTVRPPNFGGLCGD